MFFLCKQFNNPKLKVLSWLVLWCILPFHNFSHSKYYISPTKLMNFLHACTSNYSPSAKWNANATIYTWKLLLSGNINLNVGPVARHQLNDPKFEAFNNKGLHLIDLSVNSLLPKIDELRKFAKCSNAAVIGITETKLGNSLRLWRHYKRIQHCAKWQKQKGWGCSLLY